MGSIPRKFDIAVLGVTGFTGYLVAEYLANSAPTSLQWAIAGRSQDKLEQTLRNLKQVNADRASPQIIVADTSKSIDCENLAKNTRVVITTVGPYSKYGELLVKACAENGTHYCDLTGEIPWVKEMISKYEATAIRSGAVLIPCSGFESVPSDIGVYVLTRYIRQHFGSGTINVRSTIRDAKGGVSGGTLDSVFSLMDRYTLGQIRAAHSPWSISPSKGPAQGSTPHVLYDPDFGAWQTSALAEAVDMAVIHRSWGLRHDYGQNFTYRGYLQTRGAIVAYALLAAIAISGLALVISPVRWLLRKIVTQPGSGPSAEAMKKGRAIIDVVGESETQPRRKVMTTVDIKGDPGYLMTARMLTEVALTLAFDLKMTKAGEIGGGFATPATLGDKLVDRLGKAGITFTARELSA